MVSDACAMYECPVIAGGYIMLLVVAVIMIVYCVLCIVSLPRIIIVAPSSGIGSYAALRTHD